MVRYSESKGEKLGVVWENKVDHNSNKAQEDSEMDRAKCLDKGTVWELEQ